MTSGSCPALESGSTIGLFASGAAGCPTSVTCCGSWVLGKLGASHAQQLPGEGYPWGTRCANGPHAFSVCDRLPSPPKMTQVLSAQQ